MPPVEVVIKNGTRKVKFEIEEKQALGWQDDEVAVPCALAGGFLAVMLFFAYAWLTDYLAISKDSPFFWTIRFFPNCVLWLGFLATGANLAPIHARLWAGMTFQPSKEGAPLNNDFRGDLLKETIVALTIYAALVGAIVFFVVLYRFPHKTVDLDRLKAKILA